MTGTNCDLFTHKSSRSYLNHLVYQLCFDGASVSCCVMHVFVYCLFNNADSNSGYIALNYG